MKALLYLVFELTPPHVVSLRNKDTTYGKKRIGDNMNSHNLKAMQHNICEQASTSYTAVNFPVSGLGHSFFQQEKMSISVSNETSQKAVPLVSGNTTILVSM